MNTYLILHRGFKKPTSEDMDAWKKWFASIADIQKDRGGLRGGKEITSDGSRELPFGEDALTGYTIIEADSMDEATRIAGECPIVGSTRVYQIHR